MPANSDLLQRAIAAARAKNNAEARKLLLLAIELDDHDEQAWLWLSSVVESATDQRVCLENVLAINPDNRAAQKGLRWLDEHAPASQAEVEHCPHCNAALPVSGDTCPACKQPVLIVCPHCGDFTEISKAQCIHCGHFFGDFRQRDHYYAALAVAYADIGKLSPAQWAVDQALAAMPHDAEVWQNIARVRVKLDRPDDAIAAYQQAIVLSSDQPNLYLELLDLYQRENRPAEAQGWRDQAFKQFQTDPARLIEIGQTLADRRTPIDAITPFFERAVHLQPKDVSMRLQLGGLYFDQRDYATARQHLQRAVDLTDAKSSLGQQAREALARAKTAGADRSASGRGEVIRQLIGPVLISIMAALANARLSLDISLISWLALGVSGLGAWLWASASEALSSTSALAGRYRREQIAGFVVWLIGFSVIVAKV